MTSSEGIRLRSTNVKVEKGASKQTSKVIHETVSAEQTNSVTTSTVVAACGCTSRLVTYNEVPEYLKDNEYIIGGYRCNLNAKGIARSLFQIHNESVNVWTHLLGCGIFLFLLFHTIFFLSGNLPAESGFGLPPANVTEGRYTIEQINSALKPLSAVVPSLDVLRDSVRSQLDEAVSLGKSVIPDHVAPLIHGVNSQLTELADTLRRTGQELQSRQAVQDILEKVVSVGTFLKSQAQGLKGATSAVETAIHRGHNTLSDIFHTTSSELSTFLSFLQQEIDSVENSFLHSIEPEPWRNPMFYDGVSVPKWPLVVFILSALCCLFCSATYHLCGVHSPRVFHFLARLDYAGISILIAGSAVASFFYGFYCHDAWRIFYVTLVSVLSFIVFVTTLLERFHTPDYRYFRMGIFIALGICAGTPFTHLLIKFGFMQHGYAAHRVFLYALVMGFLYIFGAVMYGVRIPERFRPGFFDIWGHSHQFFHVLVVIAALVHYVGCIENFRMRHAFGCEAV
eukprot:GILK01002636.1.p1 GENE.GILK01002636.1~~GILK01002636.1.p1  ORF type:complete len:524 (+),score=62.34 GILK01002636.1:45-1574(+)